MERINRLQEIIKTYDRFEAEFKNDGIDIGKTDGGGF